MPRTTQPHTTNYFDTFIEVAPDCPAGAAQTPPAKDPPTVANLQFEMISAHPYRYTSDDVTFEVHAMRNQIAEADRDAERERFFSTGQACLRSSPLTKRYGWGVHSDAEGRVALFPLGSPEYEAFRTAEDIARVPAMRSKRG